MRPASHTLIAHEAIQRSPRPARHRGTPPQRRSRRRGAGTPRAGGLARTRRAYGEDHALRARIDSAASLSLVFGLLAVFVIPLIGPLALLKGYQARSLAQRHRRSPPAIAAAGMVLGWLATLVMILALIGLALIAADAMGSA